MRDGRPDQPAGRSQARRPDTDVTCPVFRHFPGGAGSLTPCFRSCTAAALGNRGCHGNNARQAAVGAGQRWDPCVTPTYVPPAHITLPPSSRTQPSRAQDPPPGPSPTFLPAVSGCGLCPASWKAIPPGHFSSRPRCPELPPAQIFTRLPREDGYHFVARPHQPHPGTCPTGEGHPYVLPLALAEGQCWAWARARDTPASKTDRALFSPVYSPVGANR